MSRGASKVVNTCMKVQPGEQILIVTELSRLSIAQALAAEVYRVGAEPAVCIMEPRTQDSQEPPKEIAAAMLASDGFLSVVGKSITHTQAVKEAVAQGARGLVLTHFTEEMLVRGGIEADFPAIAPTCRAIAQALQGAQTVRLTSRHGTDLTYSAKGRRGNALYGVVEPGEFSTIPTIEANVSPLEGTANGVIVADASIPYIGIGVLEEPVVCHVKDGRITSIEGGRQAQMLKDDLAGKADPNVYNIAEMGMGLNPKCHFCGFMLEDEGVEGSVHIGIGTKAACHYDLIMTGATVVADGKVLLQDGVVQL